jgi:hypothetical protein
MSHVVRDWRIELVGAYPDLFQERPALQPHLSSRPPHLDT